MFVSERCCPVNLPVREPVPAGHEVAYLIVADGNRVVDVVANRLDLLLQQGVLLGGRLLQYLLLLFQCHFLS